MSWAIEFDVRMVPAGTGSAVWDDPHVDQLIHRFMPHDREHGPMLGVVHMGAARPTPRVLRNLVVTVGEDVRAGRYGSFSLFICSEDEDTRCVDRRCSRIEGRSPVRLPPLPPISRTQNPPVYSLRRIAKLCAWSRRPVGPLPHRALPNGSILRRRQQETDWFPYRRRGTSNGWSSPILLVTSSSTLARWI